jgi:hypothetical protein
MAKTYKPDFIYIKSDLLKQEVAVSKKTGWVYCEDEVKYSPQEMEIIRRAGGVLDAATHAVKKIIGGEVVKIERLANKTSESGHGAGSVHNTDTGKKISGVSGNSAESGQGELEIY